MSILCKACAVRKRPLMQVTAHPPHQPSLAKDPPATRPSREPVDAILLLLIPDPLHPHATPLKRQPVPSDRFPDVLWTQRTATFLDRRGHRGLGVTALSVRVRRRHSGSRGRWQIRLLLARLRDPLSLHASRALNDVANVELADGAHADNDGLGDGLGDGGVDELNKQVSTIPPDPRN